MEKTCCIIDYRDIPKESETNVRCDLIREVYDAVYSGYRKVLTGAAAGAGLIFLDVIAGLREAAKLDVVVEAVIPYRGRLQTIESMFQKLIKQCDNVHIFSEIYRKSAYTEHNRFMVDNSQRVIVFSDGRGFGETAKVIEYARTQGKEIRVIEINSICHPESGSHNCWLGNWY